MYRTEITIIRKSHRLYKLCDELCFKSKNLYNYANYVMRKEFVENKKVYSPTELNFMLKTHETFKALPSKTSQLTLLNLTKNWKSYFRGIKDWKENKSKYTGMPKLPKYKSKNGRHVVQFDYRQGMFKDGRYYIPNRLIDGRRNYSGYIETKITKKNFIICRIIPYGNCYKIEMVYKVELPTKESKNNNYLAIDLGIDNLATLTNNIGVQPIVINGRTIKSINNYYNKLLSQAMGFIGTGTSKRIGRIATKRNNIINTHFHRISKFIINYCVQNNIDNVVIGRNKDWQRNSNIGKKNNQKFVQLPFEKLIYQLQYKAENVGVKVSIIEEQYTSKTSFIDNDVIPIEFGDYEFSGKRINRGLYRSKQGVLINADVNGSYNILRKCNSEFKFDDRIKGIALYPVRINIA